MNKGNNLPHQYILCQNATNVPSTWQTKNYGNWYLGHDKSLPVGELQDTNSKFIGWLLGYPIDRKGNLINHLKLNIAAESDDLISKFETSIYELGGRFVAVLLSQTTSRLYLDPIGSLATVYCPQQQIVASTTTLIPYTKKCDDNRELIEQLKITQRDGWYPFGLTPRNGIARLLPNHFLDLRQWQTRRHWPNWDANCQQPFDWRIRDRYITEIANILTRQIGAIARTYPIYMSLTAGRDSRMLLACAKQHLDQIVFFTREIPDDSAKLDCEIASTLAHKFGLNHRLLPYQKATETELNQWLAQTGYCVAGRVWRSVRTLKKLKGDRIYLPGLVAEVGRAYYWMNHDTSDEPISAVELLARLKMPITPLFQQKAQQWLSQLPTKNRFQVLDFLYLEQRLGCWAAPLHYGLVNNSFCLSPFVHRRILEIMLSLPVTYRKNQLLAKDLVQQQWPELLELPFNEYVGIKSYLHLYSLKKKLKKLLLNLRQTK